MKKPINKKNMFIYSLLGCIVGGLISIFVFNTITIFYTTNPFIASSAIFILILSLFAYSGATTKTKEIEEQEIKATAINYEPLKGSQKVISYLVCIVNPVIFGSLLYYVWKKQYPTKAKEINRFSIIIVIIQITLYGIYKVFIDSK